MEKNEPDSIAIRIQQHHEFQMHNHGILFIKIGLNGKELEKLAEELSKVLFPNMQLQVFHFDGNDPDFSFGSIKKPSEMVTVSDGSKRLLTKLIFPEDKPVILVIQSFNLMKGADQVNFAALENKQPEFIGMHLRLYEGSMILAGIDPMGQDVDKRIEEKGIFIQPPFKP